MRSSWHRIDELRETWALLSLGPTRHEANTQDTAESRIRDEKTDEEIQGWEVVVGNTDRIVRTTGASVGEDGVESERDLLRELFSELDTFRYEETVLVTADDGALGRVRRRLLAIPDVHPLSFRGLTHLSLGTVLDRYLGREQSNHDPSWEDWVSSVPDYSTQSAPSEETEEIWNLWTSIVPLLPPRELAGQSL